MADPVQFDLTCKLIPYLDRHLVFPLLEFLSVQKIYDENDLRLARLDILSNTKMVDFAMDIYKSVYPDEPVSDKLVQQRSKVVARLSKLKALTGPIIQIFEDPEVQKQLQSSRDQASLMQFLTENHNFNSEMLATLHTYAKFHYECGNYTAAADYLYLYRGIIPTNDKKFNLSLWGKLASEILTQNWENALEDLIRLRELTDSTPAPMGDTKTLQQRTWLVHWSLFVFFNHPKGRDMIIEMFLYSAPYLNTIQTTCPHILRYLATAVVINKANRRQAMKDLVRVIQQEAYAYSDPITEFISNLYVDYDFDMAQEQLTKCAVVLENDFFLVACQADFIDNARLMIFELFCRIHQCISINMLAEKLNMTPEAAELWIVNLIRQAKLDAKIDYKNAQVVMDIHSQSPYQQLIDKTKNLSFRTQMLVMNVEKKAAARSNVGSSWHHY